jgi:hypothetical protein
MGRCCLHGHQWQKPKTAVVSGRRGNGGVEVHYFTKTKQSRLHGAWTSGARGIAVGTCRGSVSRALGSHARAVQARGEARVHAEARHRARPGRRAGLRAREREQGARLGRRLGGSERERERTERGEREQGGGGGGCLAGKPERATCSV